jgi:hypothetical protein
VGGSCGSRREEEDGEAYSPSGAGLVVEFGYYVVAVRLLRWCWRRRSGEGRKEGCLGGGGGGGGGAGGGARGPRQRPDAGAWNEEHVGHEFTPGEGCFAEVGVS